MNERERILTHLLRIAAFDGWSDYAFRQAVKESGLDASSAARAFPGGVTDCLDYFFTSEDDALAELFAEGSLKNRRVPDRIETLILTRLSRWLPHREAVRRAVATRALPWNAPRGVQSLYRTVDRMWRLAGDTSLDFSFYTKRATLAALYTSTLIYWLNDSSAEFENTKEFLKRRLADIAKLGRHKKHKAA